MVGVAYGLTKSAYLHTFRVRASPRVCSTQGRGPCPALAPVTNPTAHPTRCLQRPTAALCAHLASCVCGADALRCLSLHTNLTVAEASTRTPLRAVLGGSRRGHAGHRQTEQQLAGRMMAPLNNGGCHDVTRVCNQIRPRAVAVALLALQSSSSGHDIRRLLQQEPACLGPGSQTPRLW